MNYFEDIEIGARREIGRHTFTADEIKTFAAAHDPQPFHVDEKAAAISQFGRLCASGWHTAGVCMRLLDRRPQTARRRGAGARPDLGAWGPSPGFRDLKWLKPVYVGDTIGFATEPVETRLSQSRAGWGLVTMRHTGTNQHGELVYSIIVSAFVQCRPA